MAEKKTCLFLGRSPSATRLFIQHPRQIREVWYFKIYPGKYLEGPSYILPFRHHEIGNVMGSFKCFVPEHLFQWYHYCASYFLISPPSLLPRTNKVYSLTAYITGTVWRKLLLGMVIGFLNFSMFEPSNPLDLVILIACRWPVDRPSMHHDSVSASKNLPILTARFKTIGGSPKKSHTLRLGVGTKQ